MAGFKDNTSAAGTISAVILGIGNMFITCVKWWLDSKEKKEKKKKDEDLESGSWKPDFRAEVIREVREEMRGELEKEREARMRLEERLGVVEGVINSRLDMVGRKQDEYAVASRVVSLERYVHDRSRLASTSGVANPGSLEEAVQRSLSERRLPHNGSGGALTGSNPAPGGSRAGRRRVHLEERENGYLAPAPGQAHQRRGPQVGESRASSGAYSEGSTSTGVDHGPL